MKRLATAAVIGLVCIGGAASAQGSPDAIVRGRQAGMALSGAAMSGIKAAIDAGQAPSAQRGSARALARWSHALPGLFPEGSDPGSVQTGARPEVWSDRAGFDAKAAEFATAADRLAELSQGEDAAAFAAQWTVVRAGCQSCHEAYKQ